MKVTLKQVADAAVGIRNVEVKEGSEKWMYAIPRNKGKMKDDMQGIANAEKTFEEVNQKRLAYCIEHCDKDKDGKPIIENEGYKGVDPNDPILVEMVARMRDLDAKFVELLKTEVEIDFHMIAFEDVPRMAPIDFERISIFVKEPEVKQGGAEQSKPDLKILK
jgi:hypothetical protein